MEEPELLHVLQSPEQSDRIRQQDFIQRLEQFRKELDHPHMTKQLLWEEYKRDYPDGYQYSRFCHYLQLYNRHQQVTMPIQHKAGDKLFLDFAGDKMHYIDRDSGELITCEVFVTTMGYRNIRKQSG
jgi:transposase